MTRVVVLLLLSLVTAPYAYAESAPTDTDAMARAIYGDFMSPYCPGLLLADCRSQAAVDLRAHIRDRLASGVPASEVRAALEATYGEKLRAAPAARGFGLWAWLTPGVFVLIGAGFVLLWAQRRSDREVALDKPGKTTLDPALQARLDTELRSFDAG